MSTLQESESRLVEGRRIYKIPMVEIFADENFNCRGPVEPRSCIELADSIKTKGLQLPVLVRPFEQGKFKFSLVQGFRRFMAHRINKAETIEAEIRVILDDTEAEIANIIENVERENLTFMQEARACFRLHKNRGLTAKEIANYLDFSLTWAQIRLTAMSLEPEIQRDIESGMLSQEHIKAIATLEPGQKRFDAVKQIKTARLRGESKALRIGKPSTKSNIFTQKRRGQVEIEDMQDHIIDSFGGGDMKRVPEAARRVIAALGWTNGDASSLEVYEILRKIAEENGLHYSLPDDVLDQLKHQATQ